MAGMGHGVGINKGLWDHPTRGADTPGVDSPEATYYQLPTYPGEIDTFPELTDEESYLSAVYLNFAAMVVEQIEAEVGVNPSAGAASIKDLLNAITHNRNSPAGLAGKIAGIYRKSQTGVETALEATGQSLTYGSSEWDYDPKGYLIGFGHMSHDIGQQNWNQYFLSTIIFADHATDKDKLWHRMLTSNLRTGYGASGTFTFEWVVFRMKESN